MTRQTIFEIFLAEGVVIVVRLTPQRKDTINLINGGAFGSRDVSAFFQTVVNELTNDAVILGIPISDNLYQLLLKKKQEQERNSAVLGSDYIDYHYTREYEPLVEGRNYESFSKKTNHRGGFTIDRLESGIINPYGIG